MLSKALKKPLAFAEIFRNIGEVFFASVFISSIFSKDVNFRTAFLGILFALTFWFFSIYLERK